MGCCGSSAGLLACSVQSITKSPRITYTDFAHTLQIPRHFPGTLQMPRYFRGALQMPWHLRVFPQRRVQCYTPPLMNTIPSPVQAAAPVRTPSTLAPEPISPQFRENRSVPRTLAVSSQRLKITKRTQFKMDVKTYNYGGYAQFSVFENCKTNPISPVLYPADLAPWRCPRPAALRSETDSPADRGRSSRTQNL